MATTRISVDRFPEGTEVFLREGATYAYHFWELTEKSLSEVEETLKAALKEIEKVRTGEYDEVRKVIKEKGYDLV